MYNNSIFKEIKEIPFERNALKNTTKTAIQVGQLELEQKTGNPKRTPNRVCVCVEKWQTSGKTSAFLLTSAIL